MAIRETAVRAGLKVSEYGIEDVATGEVFATADEAEVYKRLGMEWIPPELRENRGELKAARDGTLPSWSSSTRSAATCTCTPTGPTARRRSSRWSTPPSSCGRSYVAITDHSPAVGFGMGLDAGRLRAQIERVRALAAKLEPAFTLLVGCEVDILKDGSLDYSDELLAELDVVVASVHASHRLSQKDQTARVCEAMRNPHVDILGHPTGRTIGVRDANPLDMEQVVAVAVETGTVLEVSGQPERLDLSDVHVRMALEAGARLVIDTDGHSLQALSYMRFGVMNARRGLGDRRRRDQHPGMARGPQAPEAVFAGVGPVHLRGEARATGGG